MSAISKTVAIGNGHQLIFKGSGCFQFPEAVVTSAANESLRSTKCSLLQALAVL